MHNVRKIFPRGKKGFNDIVVLGVSFAILLFATIFISASNEAFDTTGGEYDTEQIREDVGDSGIDFGMLQTFFRLAFWDAGNAFGLPVWLDVVFTLLFGIIIFTIARNIVPFTGSGG